MPVLDSHKLIVKIKKTKLMNLLETTEVLHPLRFSHLFADYEDEEDIIIEITDKTRS
ncbi:hypothetical protein JW979_11110 [bacterium]|nr:hypothetical protein [candidate division CSSED10-310 bacterium]